MPIVPARPPRPAEYPSDPSVDLVLREARRLHRAATAGPLSAALPVLRRVLAAGAVQARTLPALHRARAAVQRKHVLRTLAFEAGFATWEAYRRALPRIDPHDLQHLTDAQRGAATLKLWFASAPRAATYAAEHGGRVVRVGTQAVVLPASHADRQRGHGA